MGVKKLKIKCRKGPYQSPAEEAAKDGRKFQFGPSRNIGRAIRILDKEGNEQYLATIRFFESEEE
ncbi:MAG: hypothetical protein HFI46_17605 [Lachnospiraceae bacterium]|nr:hypothetical protein [Lachnospiraceae bacterium]